MRAYHCNDPACPGYPQGHRHARTCDTRMPPQFRRGAVLGCLVMAIRRTREAARCASRNDYPTAAAELTRILRQLESVQIEEK